MLPLHLMLRLLSDSASVMLAGKSIPYSNEGTGPDRRICKFHVRATPDGNFFEVYHEVITGQYTHFDPRPIHRYLTLMQYCLATMVSKQPLHLPQAPQALPITGWCSSRGCTAAAPAPVAGTKQQPCWRAGG